MSYFNNVTSDSEFGSEAQQAIEKALTTGNYGTDSSTFINGRAMIPEDLESTMVNVVAQMKEDCKLLNSMKKTPVKSTVHEYNRRTDHGDFKHVSVAEGAESVDTNQAIERKTVNIKYLQTRRSVTKQMETVDTFENAYASEKLAGVEVISKGIEYQMFHGDSDVIGTEFDGFLATLKKAGNTTTTEDFRGASIATKGETVFDEIARKVYEKNGDLEKVMFPPVLAKDVKELFAERLRFTPVSSNGSFTQMPDYSTAIGSTLKFAGDNAGADKFFQVKGKVEADGSTTLRPNAPTVSGAASASVAGSQFVAADAGDYVYTVHAINAYGTSAASEPTSAITVAAGGAVTLTITPASSGANATGFVICRSKKDGTETMEMCRVGKDVAATTTFVDKNEELPGTATMLFLPKPKIMPAYDYAQLLPVSTYPLYPKDKAETPFLVMAYGALEVKAPEHCAIAKNISYTGGLY